MLAMAMTRLAVVRVRMMLGRNNHIDDFRKYFAWYAAAWHPVSIKYEVILSSLRSLPVADLMQTTIQRQSGPEKNNS